MTQLDPAALLASGDAFADLSSWRKVAVTGTDAGPWLQDLVSADVAGLAPGRARRSLLLSPTGRIRAVFTVARTRTEWLLVQDPTQPRPVDGLLAPYVLSSDVRIQERTDDLALFALPGSEEAAAAGGSAPSCLGPAGFDLLVPAAQAGDLKGRLERSLTLASDQAVDAWRTREGIPRFGVDALEDDLPQEAGLDDAVAFDKGCYLGQESVAKVRNLGHPRRLVLRFAAWHAVAPGEAVLSDGDEVGVVTSAAPDGAAYRLLARIRWDARDASLRTPSGPLEATKETHPSRPV